jgi:mannose-6-phosphate isomerase-like protein (cupin superfamily)
MQKKNLSTFLTRIDEPWKGFDLALLDGTYRVSVVQYRGEYIVHRHDKDEFFLVLDGEVDIRLRSGKIKLGKGESYWMKKGVPHQSCSPRGAYVLVVEAADITTKEVKNDAGFSGRADSKGRRR